ncbi:sigmaY antisigma factor component [Bacillus sp. JCM 19034]|uniref:sigmaY antisigma factor component n=1 Tax=Bacillus sp. JCM 19034 TaxID=1481928 RepID=UPI000ADAD52C|nr:sigmaY antisigma factor component [Bacillus sp. JCM 19034]
MNELKELNLSILILLSIILFIQSIWLFKDAQKRRGFKWFWGIWGLQVSQCQFFFIFYLLYGLRIDGRRKEVFVTNE